MSYFCNVLSVKEEKDTTATRQWDAAFTDGGFRLVWVKWEGMRQRHLFSFYYVQISDISEEPPCLVVRQRSIHSNLRFLYRMNE